MLRQETNVRSLREARLCDTKARLNRTEELLKAALEEIADSRINL